MSATTEISSRCLALVEAAIRQFPEVFGTEVKPELVKRLEPLDKDERAQMYATRYFLLEWAGRQCGSCQACSLHNNRVCGPVWADGRPNARVFVIGEGPGQFEARTAVPFTHTPELNKSWCRLCCANFDTCYPEDTMSTGKRLPAAVGKREKVGRDETARRYGEPVGVINTASEHLNRAIDGLFTREIWNNGASFSGGERVPSDLYITNLVKCRSMDGTGKDQTPTKAAITACSKWLDIQLAVVQPQVVILMGTPAGAAVFGKSDFKITAFEGKFAPRKEGGMPRLPKSVQYVGCMFHPSYISHNDGSPIAESAYNNMRKVFEQARQVLAGG